MRLLNDHTGDPLNDLIRIETIDDPRPSGAQLKYQVYFKARGEWNKGPRVEFHNAPAVGKGLSVLQPDPLQGVPELIPNGLTNEVLLTILIDRLRAFQAGPFGCVANDQCLWKLEEASHWLHSRSKERQQRGVIGKQEK